MLMERAKNTTSKLAYARIKSLAGLLDELTVKPSLTFEITFEGYAAMLDYVAIYQDQKSARVQFQEALISKNGLAVIILENRGNR